MTAVRDSVARYLARGLRPMPMFGVDESGRCRCGGVDRRTGKACNAGKHSLDEGAWKNGHAYRVEDFTEQDNVAVALGPWRPGSWLVCLDFDGVTDGIRAAVEVERFFALRLPSTLSQRSPRGLHLFYAVPAYEPLGNWNDVLATKHREGWALDLRYARGRVNVAPSRSAFGEYRWIDERMPVLDLPSPIVTRVLAMRRARGLPVLDRWQREGKRP